MKDKVIAVPANNEEFPWANSKSNKEALKTNPNLKIYKLLENENRKIVAFVLYDVGIAQPIFIDKDYERKIMPNEIIEAIGKYERLRK
jgi:hypothetical protein